MFQVPLATARGCQACHDEIMSIPFTMAFQPIVDVVERRIVAHEALVRGPSGEPASSVLQQVTSANLYAFDQACRVRAIEHAASSGLHSVPGCRLNINFMPNAVYEPRACIRRTLDAASRTGFPVDRLTFEIVEQEAMNDDEHTRRIIEEYRRHGFQIALDDFGTGYSNLDRLNRLRPDIVKLDRALVSACDQDHFKLAIVASIVALSHDVGFRTVVEGVENAGELAALRSTGVRFVQGFHFARPRFEGLVRERDIFHD